MVDDQSASAARVAKLQSVKFGIGRSKPTSAGVRSPRPSTPWQVAQLARKMAWPSGGGCCEAAATTVSAEIRTPPATETKAQLMSEKNFIRRRILSALHAPPTPSNS